MRCYIAVEMNKLYLHTITKSLRYLMFRGNKSKNINKLWYPFKYPPNSYLPLCVLPTKYKVQNSDYWLAESKVMGYKKNAWEDAFLSMFI